MELIVFVKRTIIDILSILSIPSQLTSLFRSFNISSFKSIPVSSLVCLAVEFIVFESSLVGHFIRTVLSILGVGSVVVEVTFVICTVREDIGSSSVGPSVVKVAHIDTSILLVHFSETVWFLTVLNI